MLMGVAIISCSSDDDSQIQITEKQLLGEWDLIEFTSFMETERIIE